MAIIRLQSLGNHEFDDGIDGLTPFVERANFPVLAANIDTTSEPRIDGRVLPSITIEVEGRRIGIIGYVTPETLVPTNFLLSLTY